MRKLGYFNIEIKIKFVICFIDNIIFLIVYNILTDYNIKCDTTLYRIRHYNFRFSLLL